MTVKVTVNQTFEVEVGKLTEFGEAVKNLNSFKPKCHEMTWRHYEYNSKIPQKVVAYKSGVINKKPLTKTSKELDDFIKGCKKMPSTEKIAKHFKISKSTASKRMSRLRLSKTN